MGLTSRAGGWEGTGDLTCQRGGPGLLEEDSGLGPDGSQLGRGCEWPIHRGFLKMSGLLGALAETHPLGPSLGLGAAPRPELRQLQESGVAGAAWGRGGVKPFCSGFPVLGSSRIPDTS